MTTYDYGPGSYDMNQLQQEIVAAGLPNPAGMNGSGYQGPGTSATHVDIAYETPLAPAQKTTLDSTVAAHVPQGPRKARPLWQIRGDVQALSAGQLSNTWNDLSAPAGAVPRKYLGTTGPNAGSLFVYDHVYYVLGGTAAQLRAAQISMTSMYVQDPDNWGYLKHPPFDPTIFIDPSEPA